MTERERERRASCLEAAAEGFAVAAEAARAAARRARALGCPLDLEGLAAQAGDLLSEGVGALREAARGA